MSVIKDARDHPIRAFAVLCVAATSGYVMWLGNKQLNILSSPEWCSKALQAEKISTQNFGGLTACTDLLKIQLNAVARGFLVSNVVIALCLLTLIVVVIAGARLAGKFRDIAELNLAAGDAPYPPAAAAAPAAAPVPTPQTMPPPPPLAPQTMPPPPAWPVTGAPRPE
jgi:hypothetical protein